MVYFLLFLALAGFGYAVWRFGFERACLLPFWRSLGYAPQSSFKRTVGKKTGMLLLDIMPARPPLRFIFLMGGVTVALQIVAMLLGRMVGGGFMVTVIGAVVAAAVVVTIWLPFVHAQRHRKPIRIGVTSAGIRAADKSFAAGSIGQIYVRAAIDVPQNLPFLHERFAAIVTNIGRGATRVLASRAWLVTFYYRGSGREEILAGGLTQENAENLAETLIEALQRDEKPVMSEEEAPATSAPAMRPTLDIE